MLLPVDRSITPDVYWQSRLQLSLNRMPPRPPYGTWKATLAFTLSLIPGQRAITPRWISWKACRTIGRLASRCGRRSRGPTATPVMPDLVEGVVEEHRLHRRLAESEAERLLVALALNRQGDGLRRAGSAPVYFFALDLGMVDWIPYSS